MTPQKITNNQLFVLQFYLSQGLFVGEAFGKLYHYTNKDTWISIIIGTLLGIILIYIQNQISKKCNYNLNKALNKNFSKYLFYPIIYCFYFLMIFLPTLIINILINSYYLQNTSYYFIVIPFILLALFLSLKGIKTIGKVAELFFPLTLINVILLSTGFIPYVKITNLLPILTSSFANIMISALFFAVLTTLPNFLLIDADNQEKLKLKNYLISCLTVFIINFTNTTVLGKYFLQIYSFPEYMVLKRITLLSFIENFENIAFIPWFFNSFLLISLAMNKLYHLTKTKYNILFYLTIIIILYLLFKVFIPDYSNIILIYKNAPIIIGILAIILGPILYLCIKKDG